MRLQIAKLEMSKNIRILDQEMELDISLQKLHCRKHLTSPLPTPRQNTIGGGGGRPLSPLCGGATVY